MYRNFYELDRWEIKEMVDIIWEVFMEQLQEWIPNENWEMLEELPPAEQDEILEGLMKQVKEKL